LFSTETRDKANLLETLRSVADEIGEDTLKVQGLLKKNEKRNFNQMKFPTVNIS